MKNPVFSILLTVLLAATGTASSATENVELTIKATIYRVFPDVEISRIRPAPINGLYEVLLGTDVIYITKDGRYVLQGDLIDLQQLSNLSEIERSRARRAYIEEIPSETTITFAANKQEHDIYVFTDINCGYCRRLHQDVPQLNSMGVSVHYLAFPRAGEGSGTFREMEAVWCSKDKNKAMTMAKAGTTVRAKKCDNPVKQQLEMGQVLGVRGTPAIYLEDGTELPGYMPPDRIIQEIANSQ